MKRLSLLLVCVGVLLGTAAAAQAASTYFYGATGGKSVKPRELYLSADGTLDVIRMSWKQWGGPTAQGTGTAAYHGCTPTCAQGKEHQAKVKVTLYDRQTCKGLGYYNRVKIANLAGRQLFASDLRLDKWAPCKE